MSPPTEADLPWSLTQKVVFRFLFLFLLIRFFTFPFSDNSFWENTVAWIASHVLHIGYVISHEPNGSTDRTYDYVLILFSSFLATLATIVWTVLDRPGTDHRMLLKYVTVYVRYYLASVLLSLGFQKIFRSQFPPFENMQLLETYGHSSPMGLMWTFMMYSGGYTIFSGVLELLAGVLLLFRRTYLLGALLSAGVMANIVALNLCYDLPVKLYSIELLLMTLVLISVNSGQLVRFFLTHQSTGPEKISPYFSNRRFHHVHIAVKSCFLVLLFYSNIEPYYSGYRQKSTDTGPGLLNGIYNVDLFVRNGDTLPPLITDSIRWNKMVTLSKGYVQVRSMPGGTSYFAFRPDTLIKMVTMFPATDTVTKSMWQYLITDPDHVALSGIAGKDTLQIFLRKENLNDYQLRSGGLHWVNEKPNTAWMIFIPKGYPWDPNVY